jgi:hypothetical protein
VVDMGLGVSSLGEDFAALVERVRGILLVGGWC